ncbi:glycosyltransferase [Marixanthomonas ophiurae]|uniref:Glycosyltransferase n=1 Tax=Marixanthomonas ophiurae TaxID=387659 RepID=A0A3E1QD10_9FLAO|nr:glycosyltransferase [Marixanthomonas ophiurae]RFN60039.1 glycosyltransferase [Marixanthomonas ophiurae]
MQKHQNIASVAVWMVTYNHQDFIEKAVESVMMQQTNFPFQLIIGEDCSTDATQAICKRLKSKYPEKITLFLNETNLGSFKNAQNIYKTCYKSKAKYVSILEGDDYWTDPEKLQKQVDFLEGHSAYSMAFHDAFVIDANENRIQDSKLKKNRKCDQSSQQLKRGAVLPVGSLVFRNIFPGFPPEIENVLNADTFLLSFLGQHGKGKYMLEIKPSAYRLHSGGIWSAISRLNKIKNKLSFLGHMNNYYKALNDHETSVVYRRKEKKLSQIYLRETAKTSYISHFKTASVAYLKGADSFKDGFYFVKQLGKFVITFIFKP